eukprot:m.165148 g.165148  ORF g.165148 m.165148 type:complete len:456 (-) comp12523_c0_seq1:557-1924(-)
MFAHRFSAKDLKVQLKLAINRIKMLMRKKENQGLLAKKEVAELLGKDKVELARIKTELIIKDDYLIETLEILEVFFNVLLSRMGLIERQKEVHAEIREAVMTILWAGPRLEADITEMPKICSQLTARFGKPVAELAITNTENCASERVVSKMTVTTPLRSLVEAYLAAIAKTYNVAYNYIEPMDPSLMDPTMQATVTPDMFPDVPGSGTNTGDWGLPPTGGGGGGSGSGGGMPDLPFPVMPNPRPTSFNPTYDPSANPQPPPSGPYSNQQPPMPGGIFPPAGGPPPGGIFPPAGGPAFPSSAQAPQHHQPHHEQPKQQPPPSASAPAAASGGSGWDTMAPLPPGAAAPTSPPDVDKHSAGGQDAPSPRPAAPPYTADVTDDPFPVPPSDGGSSLGGGGGGVGERESPDSAGGALSPGFPTAPGQGGSGGGGGQPPGDVPEFDDLLARFKHLKGGD